MLSDGALINGRYEITGLIGHGGMSNVYSAVECSTGKTLAVKEAVRKSAKEQQTMELSLAAEGQMLKNLYNPHLPRIYDVIENTDHIMIVMDFVPGKSLDKLIEEKGAVPPETIIEWAIQICDVFNYLHMQNPPVIYRDMKPANVILTPTGNIVLIDFGTARTWKVGVNKTSDTVLIGTEGFAAPEQFGGIGQSDARTDIFCLGATMFNLATAHSPYLKPFGITPLGNWIPALAGSPLDRIIQKCTAQDPDARFQTANELKETLIAARGNKGNTRFLSKLGLGNTKKNKGWQNPLMKVQNGNSGKLNPAQKELAASEENQTFQTVNFRGRTKGLSEMLHGRMHEPAGNDSSGYSAADEMKHGMDQMYDPTGQDTVWAQDIRGRSLNEENPLDVSLKATWEKVMYISLTAGIILLVLGVIFVLFKIENFGIVSIVAAVGAVILGGISAFMYIRG